MEIESSFKSDAENKSFFNKPLPQLSVLLILFITAFALRLYHITKPPLDFGPVRQYQQAHIARGMYFETLDSVPEWKKQMARLNMKRMGYVLEPRIIEKAAVWGYIITGGEHLWIPRVLSVIAWMSGGIFLYLIARKITSSGAALFSTAFYLFVPFGISASRSFQPDPMMTMMIIVGIYTIILYDERPTKLRLLIAAAAAAVAILVKPYSVFIIFFTFFAFSIYRKEILKSVLSSNFITFTVISMMPVVVYYVSFLLSDVGYLREHAQNSFVPHIIMYPYFWRDWYKIIGDVIGYLPFLTALAGLFLAKEGRPRVLLSALWVSYIIFGIAATHHIHTHKYYQMQFIPVVSLSLVPAIDEFMKRLNGREFKVPLIAVFIVVSLSIVSSIVTGDEQQKGSGLKDRLKSLRTVIGINPELKQFLTNDFEKDVRIAKEIGEIVNHSTNAVLLTYDFGRSLAYHGDLSGLPWPTAGSLLERKERGLEIPPKEEIYNVRYLTIRTHDKYIRYSPDYFIVMNFKEYNEQTDLKEFLSANFPVMSDSDDYLIFDLRSMNR